MSSGATDRGPSTTTPAPRPAFEVPAGACDAHLHVFDPRFPVVNPGAPRVDTGTAAAYRLLQGRLGTQRAVIVQPKAYGVENRATLAAIAALGRDHTRGIAVVDESVTDDTLRELHAGGVRGIRFSLHERPMDAPVFATVESIAHRVHAFGWHLQLHWRAAQIAAHAALIERLPCELVFDHLGRIAVDGGVHEPALELIGRLLDRGRAWVKLSGPYLNTVEGPPFADTVAFARIFVARAPERLVWGSDWPYVTEAHKPDGVDLLNLLAQWVPDVGLRRRILVDNPARLYGFAAGES